MCLDQARTETFADRLMSVTRMLTELQSEAAAAGATAVAKDLEWARCCLPDYRLTIPSSEADTPLFVST